MSFRASPPTDFPMRTCAWMAWRALKARKGRTGLSFMTLVSILGVAIGVAALIIVLSVMGGFEFDLRQKMLNGQPHMEILAKENPVLGFSSLEFSKEKIQAELGHEEVKVSPFVKSDVVLKQKRHLSSATLIGVQPEDMENGENQWAFEGTMVEGDLKDLAKDKRPSGSYPGIILGDTLAVNLSVNLGDTIEIISSDMNVGQVLSGNEIMHRFEVVGLFRSSMFDYDLKWAVVDLSEARKFMPEFSSELETEEYVTGIGVNLKDPFRVDVLQQKFKDHFVLSATTWKEQNSSLLFALKLEKFTMGAILMLIVVVAAFSISGTMMMTVFHRRQQVSLLRSLGMSRSGIAKLYLYHGCMIGTLGIILGLTIGIGVCAFLEYIGKIALPEGVYYLTSIPVRWLPADYGVISLGAFLLSVFAATYPAMTASKQDLSGGLRYR